MKEETEDAEENVKKMRYDQKEYMKKRKKK